jgi:drug/metabolite transporter (DMT)-like permease
MVKNNSLVSWTILLPLVLVWGSSFILIKKSLLYFTAVEVGILRISITTLFLLPVALKTFKKIDKKHRNYLIISGTIGSFIPAFMFAIAQTGINSLLAGILNSLTPLFTLLLGLTFFKLKATWYNALGVFIGLVGATGLIYVSGGDQGFAFNIKYASLVLIATICYAFNVNFIKTYLKHIDSLTITALTFFYIGIPSLAYVLFFSDIPAKLYSDTDNLAGFGYISILAIAGTGIALIAFNKLIKISSPVFASSVTYLIPVIAIIWGIIDGELFKPLYIIWFALILVGVLLVNTKYSGSSKNEIKDLYKKK